MKHIVLLPLIICARYHTSHTLFTTKFLQSPNTFVRPMLLKQMVYHDSYAYHPLIKNSLQPNTTVVTQSSSATQPIPIKHLQKTHRLSNEISCLLCEATLATDSKSIPLLSRYKRILADYTNLCNEHQSFNIHNNDIKSNLTKLKSVMQQLIEQCENK